MRWNPQAGTIRHGNLVCSEMSRQSRKRRRDHGRSGGARLLLLALGVLLVAMVVGVLGAVGYVVHVVQTTPKLAALHARVGGGTSQVFASDGTSLGFIQSDEL